MKILLFGELSGVHTNLKQGLIENGLNVQLWSSGDGHKNIYGDVTFGNNLKNKRIRNIMRLLELWYLLLRVRNYDIVQIISIPMLMMPSFLKVMYIKILKKRNGKVILNVCGLDAYASCVILGKLNYSPVLNEIKEEKYEIFCARMGVKNLKNSIKIANSFSGIIVNTYEYYLPYQGFNNYLGHAPFPIKIDENFIPNKVSNPIIILYGILRKERKGHRFINEALEIIENKYNHKVQIIRAEKLSLIEYNFLLNKCNILIDQACSYCFGMNALYALSMGKVVLSGNEREAEEFQGTSIPVINILPITDDIVKKLSDLIDNPAKIEEIGFLSRKYSIENHQANNIAKQYLKLING